MTEAPRPLVDALFRCTQIGQTVGDAYCLDAATAIALASAGRHVWTFNTSNAAKERIETVRSEVRARITISDDALEEANQSKPAFASCFIDRAFHRQGEPAACVAVMQAACVPGSSVFALVRNGPGVDDSEWVFNERTAGRLFSPFGDVSIALTSGRDQICVAIDARPERPDDGPRIAAILRLTTEDRWVKQCFAALGSVASYVVAFDAGAPRRTVDFVRSHPSVVHVSTDGSSARVWERARSWTPDWILSLDSCDVLAPDAKAAILSALRSAGSSDCAFTIPSIAMWDREGTRRLDVPEEETVRLRRPSADTPASTALKTRSFNYRWIDPQVRSARRAVLTALNSMAIETTPAQWHVADGPSGPVERVAVQPVTTDLLGVALRHEAITPARVLCIDGFDIDAVAIIKDRFPTATVTGISNTHPLHPHFMQYNAQVAGDFEDIDLDLVFGDVRFDVVVDAQPFSKEDIVSRLRHVRRALNDDGLAILMFDDSKAAVRVDDLLAARSLMVSGFSIDAVASGFDANGARIVLVTARPAVRRDRGARALSIVVPVGANSPVSDRFWNDLAAEAASIDGVVVAVRKAALDEARPLPGDDGAIRRVAMYEPGIDCAVRAAYQAAPARIVCVVPEGTRFRDGWCAATLRFFADARLGLLLLDAGIAAVSAQAVDPLNWPRSYEDDRVRLAVMRGIAGRRGFTESALPDAVLSRPPIQRTSGERFAWEHARATRAGVLPGSLDGEPIT